MTKYIFINIFIRNGEYEYNSKSVHAIDATTDQRKPEVIGDQWVENFYGGKADSEGDGYYFSGKADSEGDGYYFNGGEVFVSCKECKEITEAEYNILNKFL